MSSSSGPGRLPGGSARWEPMEAMRAGWEAMKKDPVLIPVVLLVGVAGSVVPQIVNQVAGAMANSSPEAAIGVAVVGNLLNLPVNAFFAAGLMVFLLNMIRGRGAEIGAIVQGGPYFLRILGLQLLLSLVFGIVIGIGVGPGIALAASSQEEIGIAVLLAGGLVTTAIAIYVSLGLWFAGFLIVDRNCGVIEALRQSWALTQGHKGSLFLLAILMFLANLVGLMACIVGVFISSAVTQAANTWVYTRLQGEALSPAGPTDVEAFD